MGMLGHHPAAPEAPPQQDEPAVDEQAEEVEALGVELHVADLSAETTSTERRVEILATVLARAKAAVVANESTAALQRAALGPIVHILEQVRPQLLKGPDADENRLRKAALEVLEAFPASDTPMQRKKELLIVCQTTLNDDRAEHGLITLRKLQEVHKSSKPHPGMEDTAQAFFEWLKTHFEGLPAAALRQLGASQAGLESAAGVLQGSMSQAVPAVESMKITPDAVMAALVLMQTYQKRVTFVVEHVVPLMVEAVSTVGPELKPGAVPESMLPIYTEFKTMQLKTLAFLTFLARYAHLHVHLQPHIEVLCKAFVWMLQTVPDSLRKELLQCMRSMLSTPFKAGLQSRLDMLLDRNTLLGTTSATVEALRQHAFMNLAELIAASKAELTLEQMRRVVELYSKQILDTSASTHLQTTSLRLLYNIIEVLHHRRTQDASTSEMYRDLLSSILECMVAKLAVLRLQVPHHLQQLHELDDSRRVRKAREAAALADYAAASKTEAAARRRKLGEAALEEWNAEKRAATESVGMRLPGPLTGVTGVGSTAGLATNDAVEATQGIPDENAVQQPFHTAAASGANTGGAPIGDEQKPAVVPSGAADNLASVKAEDGGTGPTPMEQDSQANAEGNAIAAIDAAIATEQAAQAAHDKAATDAAEAAKGAGVPPEPFHTLMTSAHPPQERELLDFRTLLVTVLNCLKNVLFLTVAWHAPRSIAQPLPFPIKPWSSRPNDVRSVSHILTFGLPAISFFSVAISPVNVDARETLADLFATVRDGREYTDIFAPRMGLIFDHVLSNRWYMRFVRHLVDEKSPAGRTHVDRYALACLLRYLVTEKLDKLENLETSEGKLTLELLELCFEALHRIQTNDATKSPSLTQQNVPSVERVALPHLLTFIRTAYPMLAMGGTKAIGYMRALRSLFFALATTNKFPEVQAAVGNSGLHAQLVDTALAMMQGPAARTREAEEAAAELCLLVPARLEHLIPLLPRMMHAAVRALAGSDRAVGVALRVLDVWVESFNPEFIERSMVAVMKPLMAALWSHIRPPPHPFGAKVAEMLGKMGGRGRRWLGQGVSIEFKNIPEYGLRVILAFPPHTSFLVPLDRCVQLAWATVESTSADVHRRKNALRLLQICVGTLARLQLPADMIVKTKAAPSSSAHAGQQQPTAGSHEPQDIQTAAATTNEARPATPTGEPSTGGAAPQSAAGQCSAEPLLVDDALGRLQALLFGIEPSPEVPADLFWPTELGIKTKKQRAAETAMLESLLMSLMASVAVDAELDGVAREFAHATCRHFAFLLAAGWADTATPPPAPPSSRVTQYGVRGGIPAYVAALKHLQPHVLLDAFQKGLQLSSATQRAAVVECICVFLDSLVEVGEVQISERRRREEQTNPAAGTVPATSKSSTPLKESAAYLNVQQDLVMRAMHCCYGDSWASRLGGVEALRALVPRMPHRWLMRASAAITKALMAVLRALPDNAAHEHAEITSLLLDIVRRSLGIPEKVEPTGPGTASPSSGMQYGESEAMEVDEHESLMAENRGKRSSRRSGGPPRKRQARGDDTTVTPSRTLMPPSEGLAESAEEEAIAEGEGSRRLQNDLLSLVLSSKSNDAMRTAAIKCMQVLATAADTSLGVMVHSMLVRQQGDPSKTVDRSQQQEATPRREVDPNTRLAAVLGRRMLPLRSIPTQTNYAFSTAFLLRTCPEQLELSSSLATFVADACTIMELDDNSVASSILIRGQPPKPDVICKLHVGCMEVLLAALNWPAFRKDNELEVLNRSFGSAPSEATVPIRQLRERMMMVFIRRLGSKHDRVIALAAEGVKAALAHSMLEKAVLQKGLHPILLDLAHYNRITLPLLRHVHRLLDLLSGQFNNTLGYKLAEHLQKWMEADVHLYGQVQVAWEPGAEVDIAASMLEIFHKLPPAARDLLETHDGRLGIVALTIGLEEALCQLPGALVPSKLWSPYRAPLARFLNRYPEQSIAYFLLSNSRISKPDYFFRLMDMIRSPVGEPLLDAFKAVPDKFVAIFKPCTAEDDLEGTMNAQLNCLHLLRAMIKLAPCWLPGELFGVLLQRWRAPGLATRAADEHAPRNQRLESKWLAHLLINYARRHHDEIDVLFELCSAFELQAPVDYFFIREFLSKDVPREYAVAHKQAIFKHWLRSLQEATLQGSRAVNALRHLISPIVRYAVTHDQHEVMSTESITSLFDWCKKILANPDGHEQLQAETIQVCSAVLEHASSLFSQHKSDLLQYICWALKQGPFVKPQAFLCFAFFFRAYRGVQHSSVLQIFLNMLRTVPADLASRDMIRQAMDILLPLLAEPVEDGAEGKEMEWEDIMTEATPLSSDIAIDTASGKPMDCIVAHIQQALLADGLHSTTTVVVIQTIVRNRALFYPARATFMSLLVDNLNRLGLSGQANLENRLLAVDIAATLYWWDDKSPLETEGEASRLDPKRDEVVMNFLVRMAFVTCEVRDRDEHTWRRLHMHCLDVLKDAVRRRSPIPINLTFFERLLKNSMQTQQSQAQGHSAPDTGPSAPLITGLRVVGAFMEFQPENLVSCCFNQLSMMIDHTIHAKHRTPIDLLAGVIRSLYTAFPPALLAKKTEGTGAQAAKLQLHVVELLTKYLDHVAEAQTFSQEYFWYACNCVHIMRSAMQVAPESMQTAIFALLRATQRVARDHSQHSQLGLLSAKVGPREVPSDAEYIAVPSALVLSNEHRRVFLSTLIVLITGPAVRHAQTDPCILFAFLNLLRGWLLVPKQAHLTNKELLVLLQRVAQVDRLQAIPAALKPAWDAQFLDLLYTVITTKKEDDFGKEVFLRVERTFCCGLQSSDPAVRQKFFRLYSENVQRDLHERLRYIVQYQDWDFLAHTFWLKHAVALLFDCLHMRDPITLAYNSAHVPPLFNYKESLLFPASTHVSAGTTGGAPQKPSSKQPEPAAAATEGLPGGLGGETAGLQVDDQGPVDAAAQAGQTTKVPTPSLGRKVEAAAERTQRQQQGSSGAAAGSQGNQPAPVLDLNLPDGLRSRLSSHLEFLARQTALRSDALVTCLIEQVQTDPLVAHHLWVLLFPIVWTSLQKEQQTGLAKPIINLLGKEHHLRQTYLRPTVGQTLLDGISMSQPQPKIPAEMIKYMGRHFHAWHTAITMLESHVGLFPQDMRCFDAVCDLYRALGEDDMWAGLWQRRAKCEETRTAVALQQHGYIPDAQTMFLEMMSRGVGGELNMVTKSEMVLWHDRYLACCAELNQWDTMFDYAKSTDNGRLQLEAAAKLLDWVHLRQVALPKAQVQDGSPEVTMVKTQLQLAEMSLMEVDKLCKAALNQCVMQWWQMPEASPWSYAPVLHSFQRAVELSESWRVAKEFSMQGGVGSQYQDLKDIADTWKLRTPNEWEPVRWWSDVLTWRNQVYNMTIRQFNQIQAAASALHQMGYRDKAWSVNRLAHVARLHHLPEACVSAITTLYGFNAMEVQEAFVKVQEQAKAYMLRPAEYVHGLNLIASTNMDYFSPPHQAEMICLKAQFHQKLSEPDVAHNTFSEALQLWPLCPDAWVNWGRFCDERFNETKQATWLEFAATCFVQGIRLSGTEARSLVPRLLYLLMLDSQGFKVVGSVLLQSAGDLPAWVWLPWVPQLITSLQRPETPAARRILVAAAQAHPQHIYWHIRPMIPPLKDAAIKAVTAAKEKAAHDRAAAAAEATAAGKADGAASAAGTDTEMAEGSATASASAGAMPAAGSQQPPPTQSTQTPPPARPASPPIEKPMEMIAYEHAKAVVEALTPKQLPALQWLDNLIAELGARFNPRTNERLLAVVHTLLSRTYRFPLPASAEVPEAMRKELAQVCKACGGKDPAATAAATAAADGASWTNWDRYQLEFARDLDPGNAETAPKTLGELTERLKGWRTMMEAMIDDMLPPIAKLEDVASGLVEMPLEEVEMPCSAPPCPDGPDAVYIERISADVEVVRRACASSRRLAFYGSDGQARHFLLSGQQSGGAAAHASEERVSHLLRAANGLMATHPEARRRGLAFTAPRSHALSPAGRISEDDPSSTLYVDAYETYCARYGREPDAPIVAFRAATCNEDGTTSESVLKTRLEAYVEAEQAVTENVFSQYMYKTMVDNSRVMWTFKRQFALSVAMSAVACHALRLTGRAPSKVLVSKARGDITHLELAPVYNDRLQMDICGETVPFRFTRNMSSFIGPHGFEGTMVAAGVAAAQGLQKERQCIASLLALFLRDDILAFAQRRLSARSIAALKLEPRQIEHAVMFNVHHCLLRLAEIGPRDSVAAPHQVVQPPPQAVEGQMQPPPPQQSVLISPQGGFKLLIAKATDPKFLCMMDATWQPWL